MTSLDLVDLIIAFAFGVVVTIPINLWIHRQHKIAWQAEYRRLMAGIFTARHAVVDNNMSRLMVSRHLKRLYDGEKI